MRCARALPDQPPLTTYDNGASPPIRRYGTWHRRLTRGFLIGAGVGLALARPK
jgi:hypothetical protein